MADTLTEKTETNGVAPYEARGLVPVTSPDGLNALHDLMTAVTGFYYPGDRSEAVLSAVAWLQKQPQVCAALGLGAAPGETHREWGVESPDGEIWAYRDEAIAGQVARERGKDVHVATVSRTQWEVVEQPATAGVTTVGSG